MRIEKVKYASKALDDLISGRSLAGIHFSKSVGDAIKSDPRYFDLKESQKSFLENLIDRY
jgi:hypothetical protein